MSPQTRRERRSASLSDLYGTYHPAPSNPQGQQGSLTPPRQIPKPLVLQRCAPRAVRKHRNRAVMRWGSLLVGDLATLLASREILLAVRDKAVAGALAASAIEHLIPRGSLELPQLTAAVLLGLIVFGTYGPGDKRRDMAVMLSASSAGLLLVCWGWLWSDFSLWHLAGAALLLAGVGSAIGATRLLIDALVRQFGGSRKGALRSAFIGPARIARQLLQDPALNDETSISLVGYVDTTSEQHERGEDALGNIADLVRVISRYRLDTLILSGDCDAEMSGAVLDIADAAGCQVLVAPNWGRLGDVDPRLVWQHGLPLISLTRPELRGQQLVIKRAFDLLAASAALIVLSPVLALVAVAVRLSSRGPIFFSQLRVGLGGRQFRIYKFRSMTHDAETKRADLVDQSIYGDGRLFKIKDDPRITPLGRFLRRTSIDELPQLWNVVRGEMSLVGPRPPVPSEVRLYSEHHYSRFNMKPGITGPWQVSGRNTITDFEQVVRLEKEYMRGWTFWKDLAILLQTVPAVLGMDGAH